MSPRRRQHGEGNAGCLVWLLILVVLGLVLWKAVPVKVANAALYDYMVELTKFSANLPAEELKKRVLAKARELDLPVVPKQVEVEKSTDRVKIRCRYTVPLEFPGYVYNWEVEHFVDRPIFYL